jgi:hypothetical protein
MAVKARAPCGDCHDYYDDDDNNNNNNNKVILIKIITDENLRCRRFLQ